MNSKKSPTSSKDGPVPSRKPKKVSGQPKASMNEKKARELLPINSDGSIGPNYGHYMAWDPGDKDITLDSHFTVEELEALAWWMRNKSLNVTQ